MKLKELRNSIHFSQVEFAELLGVSIASLRRWETGETNPSPMAKEKIDFVTTQIENGDLEALLQKKEKELIVCEKQKQRDFYFNGKKHIVQYMPYVYNGPVDQVDFFNNLVSMQEKKNCTQDWDSYMNKLSIIQLVDNMTTEQYRLEKPKPTAKSWSADVGSHGWHRYVGRFPAQLVRAIINHFDLDEHTVLLDPFCGSGTTLVEARLLGVPALGIEISPLSAMMSRVKSTFPKDGTIIDIYINDLQNFYQKKWEQFLDGRKIESLSYLEIIKRPGNTIEAFSNYDKWFTKEALLGTSIVVEYIKKIKQEQYISEFIATALSAKMRSIGNVDVDVVRAEYRKKPRENVDVLKIVIGQLKKMRKTITEMNTTHNESIQGSESIHIIEGSCLSANIKPGSISAIITSPPYGVESLSYLRTHLLSFRALEPVLGVDPYNLGEEVIGSEYLDGREVDVSSLSVINHSKTFKEFFGNLLKEESYSSNKKRILMMMKFFEDMFALAQKFNIWLKDGGKIAFVIGNKKLGDHLIPTDTIITEIFEACGLQFESKIAHKLKTNNSNSRVPWQDRIIENEFIIFFSKELA